MSKRVLYPLLIAVPLFTIGCENNSYVSKLFKPRDAQTQSVASAENESKFSVFGKKATEQQPAVVASRNQLSGASNQVAQTDAEALYKQGYDTFYGIGMHYNEKRGIALLEQAAKQNHQKSIELLGRLANMGYTVNPDVLQNAAASVQTARVGAQGASQSTIVASDDWYYSEPAQAQQPQLSTDLTSAKRATVATTTVAAAATKTPTSAAQLAVPSRYSSDEDAFLALDKSFYTLQLVAAKSKSSVENFVIDNQLQNDVRIVKKNVGGNDWYVALYGNFADRFAAQNAAADIESRVNQAITPWVRPVDAIQIEISSRG